MFSIRNQEAKLYYLYMMSDGAISYSEEKIFDEICHDLGLNEEEKDEAINESKEIVFASEAAIELIDSAIKTNGRPSLSDSSRVLWNLINIGYSDKYYSDEEKKIVNYTVQALKINKEIYQEMVDTADTLLALIKQKDWVDNTFENRKERADKKNLIDSEINALMSDLKLSISELKI